MLSLNGDEECRWRVPPNRRPRLLRGAQPILYPNQHYKEVGLEVAERDIDVCSQMAKDAGATQSQGKTGQVAATRRQVEQWDQRRVRSGERWSKTRAVGPWWGRQRRDGRTSSRFVQARSIQSGLQAIRAAMS